MRYDGKVILAAHRGDKKNYPENTIPAFRAALDKGCDMIETDVHMTKDGVLVLIHDASTLRTTGVDIDVNGLTFEELRTLDAGSSFSPEFTGTRIPSVEEFIELIKDSDILINWELKDYPTVLGDEQAFLTADKLVELIHKHGLVERSMINSFSDRLLEYVHKKYGGEFTVHGQGIDACTRSKDESAIPRTELYDWCCLYPNVKGGTPLDNPENFKYCTDRGILPCVCVPDTAETYREYINLGCRMFTSNDVTAADKILRELGVR
jgi:glycerophosphoryl diester phosphodiesterase